MNFTHNTLELTYLTSRIRVRLGKVITKNSLFKLDKSEY
jgi:hypothetical protein